jgi:hypothetical protein
VPLVTGVGRQELVRVAHAERALGRALTLEVDGDQRGGALDESAPAHESVTIALTEFSIVDPDSAPCGESNMVQLQYRLHSDEPLVLNYEDSTPAFAVPAALLSPVRPPVAATLFSAPECLSPVVYDAAGHRTALRLLCPRTEPVLTYEPFVGGSNEPFCTLSTPGSASHASRSPRGLLGLLATASAITLRRRAARP